MIATISRTESLRGTRSHSRGSTLRLLEGEGARHAEHGERADPPASTLCTGERPNRVLLAGADGGRRATLLDELIRTLPDSTVFELADAVSDALEHAPESRMAFITGDLDDAPAGALMQTLASRHPGLPVMVMDSPRNDARRLVAGRDERLVRRG